MARCFQCFRSQESETTEEVPTFYQFPSRETAAGLTNPNTPQRSQQAGLDRRAFSTGLAASVAYGMLSTPASAGPFTREELSQLTYQQIKGTGLANMCPKVAKGGSDNIDSSKVKRMNEMCIEPTSFQLLEEYEDEKGKITVEPVRTKVTTRQTYTLTGIEGSLSTEDGKLTFKEEDGIDYAPTTIQTPGGERVPFLFSVKDLVAKSDSGGGKIAPGLKLAGSFKVPSYRTGLFLDPKGRGMTTGYDQAQALPALQAGGDDELFDENDKNFDVGKGNIELQVTQVNSDLGEVGGVFVQQQPSDTDLGSKEPKQVLLKGTWFATVD